MCTATARDAGMVTVARKEMPEAWIGEPVALRYWRGDGHATVECKLEAVGKRGVFPAPGGGGVLHPQEATKINGHLADAQSIWGG
jgi:hypothetical protein